MSNKIENDLLNFNTLYSYKNDIPIRDSISSQQVRRSSMGIGNQLHIALHGLTAQSLQLAQVIQQFYNNINILIYQFSFEPINLFFCIFPHQIIINQLKNIEVNLNIASLNQLTSHDILLDGQSYSGTCRFQELEEEYIEQTKSGILKLQKVNFLGQILQNRFTFQYLDDQKWDLNLFGWKTQSTSFMEVLQTTLLLCGREDFQEFKRPNYIVNTFPFVDTYYSILLDNICATVIITEVNKQKLNPENVNQSQNISNITENSNETSISLGKSPMSYYASLKTSAKTSRFESPLQSISKDKISNSNIISLEDNENEQNGDISDYEVIFLQQKHKYNIHDNDIDIIQVNCEIQSNLMKKSDNEQQNYENNFDLDINIQQIITLKDFISALNQNKQFQSQISKNYANYAMIVKKQSKTITGYIMIAKYDTNQQIKVGVPILYNNLRVSDVLLQELSLQDQKTQKELNIYNKLALKYFVAKQQEQKILNEEQILKQRFQ